MFLKDKKDNYFLLTVEEHATVDLKTVHQIIGAASRSPSQAGEADGVSGRDTGAVTAFGAINDTEGKVKIILDETLMSSRRSTAIRSPTTRRPRSRRRTCCASWRQPGTSRLS
ncbi:hypothetical protein F2981_04990 [Sinorhizobium meliloti]|nr:hypothetical protein [Sinorhizobium meliloti]